MQGTGSSSNSDARKRHEERLIADLAEHAAMSLEEARYAVEHKLVKPRTADKPSPRS